VREFGCCHTRKIPLNSESRQIPQTKIAENRKKVIPDHALIAILRAFGHQRHHNGNVSLLHILGEVRCGPDGFESLVERPKEFGRDFLYLSFWHG
jgi:hypothetical protein